MPNEAQQLINAIEVLVKTPEAERKNFDGPAGAKIKLFVENLQDPASRAKFYAGGVEGSKAIPQILGAINAITGNNDSISTADVDKTVVDKTVAAFFVAGKKAVDEGVTAICDAAAHPTPSPNPNDPIITSRQQAAFDRLLSDKAKALGKTSARLDAALTPDQLDRELANVNLSWAQNTRQSESLSKGNVGDLCAAPTPSHNRQEITGMRGPG